MRIEDSCKYLTFTNEPFEVHACLTYALFSRRFQRTRKVLRDRIANVCLSIGEEHVIESMEKALDLYELAVLLHDVGKLVPVYPLGRDGTNFFGHELFSFYILKKVFSDENLVETLGIDVELLEDVIYVALTPVALHHSAHRWIFEGNTMSEFIHRFQRLWVTRSRRNLDDSYVEGLARVLERVCLCTIHSHKLCIETVYRIPDIIRSIASNYNRVLWEIASDINSLKSVFSVGRSKATPLVLEVSLPVLVALLQLSDRLAAKIVRYGELSDLDTKAFTLFTR